LLLRAFELDQHTCFSKTLISPSLRHDIAD
jgi:hypothetical protein